LNLAQNLQAVYGYDDEKFEINTFRPIPFFAPANYASHKGKLQSAMILKLTSLQQTVVQLRNMGHQLDLQVW